MLLTVKIITVTGGITQESIRDFNSVDDLTKDVGMMAAGNSDSRRVNLEIISNTASLEMEDIEKLAVLSPMFPEQRIRCTMSGNECDEIKIYGSTTRGEECYLGGFKNGKRNGRGALFLPDGRKFDVEWKNGEAYKGEELLAAARDQGFRVNENYEVKICLENGGCKTVVLEQRMEREIVGIELRERIYSRACEGDPLACYQLGLAFLNGSGGGRNKLEKSESGAFEYLSLAKIHGLKIPRVPTFLDKSTLVEIVIPKNPSFGIANIKTEKELSEKIMQLVLLRQAFQNTYATKKLAQPFEVTHPDINNALKEKTKQLEDKCKSLGFNWNKKLEEALSKSTGLNKYVSKTSGNVQDDLLLRAPAGKAKAFPVSPDFAMPPSDLLVPMVGSVKPSRSVSLRDNPLESLVASAVQAPRSRALPPK